MTRWFLWEDVVLEIRFEIKTNMGYNVMVSGEEHQSDCIAPKFLFHRGNEGAKKNHRLCYIHHERKVSNTSTKIGEQSELLNSGYVTLIKCYNRIK